jgi:hypothetical protein
MGLRELWGSNVRWEMHTNAETTSSLAINNWVFVFFFSMDYGGVATLP